MHAAAGAISRARTRARAHLGLADDFFELGELHRGQRRVACNLKRVATRQLSSRGGSARCVRRWARSAEQGRRRARTSKFDVISVSSGSSSEVSAELPVT